MVDFSDQAFAAHTAVKNALKRAIVEGKECDPGLWDETLCRFGVWIHGPGRRAFGGREFGASMGFERHRSLRP